MRQHMPFHMPYQSLPYQFPRVLRLSQQMTFQTIQPSSEHSYNHTNCKNKDFLVCVRLEKKLERLFNQMSNHTRLYIKGFSLLCVNICLFKVPTVLVL